jgi:hypothetical protein
MKKMDIGKAGILIFGKLDPYRIKVKIQYGSFRRSKWIRKGPWTLTMEARRLKTEPWRTLQTIGLRFASL